VKDACDAGADGFIVPDLPIEESQEFMSALSGATRQGSEVEAGVADNNRPSTALRSAQDGGLPLIPMLAPTSSPERMEMIARNAKGFIYLVPVTGITGERKSLAEGLGDLIALVREHTSVPVCVGFGIGTPEQAREVGKMADGVIVGTACVRTIGRSDKPVETAKQFATEFRSVLQKESRQ
jgi:tryptophan synthase alpha chain